MAMKKILVTGSGGFIGKNLLEALSRITDVEVKTFEMNDNVETLFAYATKSDVIYHLAGVNRPQNDDEFIHGNYALTNMLVSRLREQEKTPAIVLASSIQAVLDNPYGISKRQAENAVAGYSEQTGAKSYIFRLPNVFGKWCRPNYNSVVATFCHNISHGLDISISDPDRKLKLVYVDDVVNAFTGILAGNRSGLAQDDDGFYTVRRVFETTLSGLADRIYQLGDIRKTGVLPDLSDEFMQCLHSTYISYIDKNELSYAADMKSDNRGNLFELIRSKHSGQIFISRSYKNITRGNHYHDSKVEKFCLVQGEAVIKLRNVLSDEIISYTVSDKRIEVVDIPPGYTHSIENLGDGEMIVIFWSSRLFDPEDPDTYYREV
jgi:UDP-2-acetamido-2,6-beta-L-arabino-hexul-4-ose reductase